MNPLKSIPGTIIAGIILAIVIAFLLGATGAPNISEIAVWFHVVVGITWVGLLYYFNFVQVPAMAAALGDTDGPGPAAIDKYVAPRALWYFRWAALLTWLSGMAALSGVGGVKAAFTFANEASALIGVGAWLGTIMLINVWGLIWPNQKKILGLDGKTHDADVIAKAKATAFTFSRLNVVLSIPMLMSMTAYGHGLPF
ncbi:MAG: urate hydroxylase PuuD [Bacteroidetes bacterium]|nr:urate hydroxylase PuuD [Bacteroidota bacterium]MBL7004814.1 urate hydroxylase PuuD [Gammaproteobacteria bacterium]